MIESKNFAAIRWPLRPGEPKADVHVHYFTHFDGNAWVFDLIRNQLPFGVSIFCKKCTLPMML